jgi:hypothetical protein
MSSGTLPTPGVGVSDKRPEKRRIDGLLARDEFAEYWGLVGRPARMKSNSPATADAAGL